MITIQRSVFEGWVVVDYGRRRTAHFLHYRDAVNFARMAAKSSGKVTYWLHKPEGGQGTTEGSSIK